MHIYFLFICRKKIDFPFFIVYNRNFSNSFRWEAALFLSKVSKVSIKNHCFITGRNKGYLPSVTWAHHGIAAGAKESSQVGLLLQ